jgi:hypothetical protein
MKRNSRHSPRFELCEPGILNKAATWRKESGGACRLSSSVRRSASQSLGVGHCSQVGCQGRSPRERRHSTRDRLRPGGAAEPMEHVIEIVLQNRTVLSLLAVANSLPSLLICHRPADDPVAADVAERLNDDAARREEDTWSA